jgi:hypothetical protein
MASVTIGAGVSTLQSSPRWWDKDEGFGYRLGTNFAAHMADVTVRDGLAALMHQDTRYQRCGCRNVFARAGHAVGSSFLARNDKGGLRLGTESLATHAGFNLVKEFIIPLFKH